MRADLALHGQGAAGFSLMEILVALVLLSILAGATAPLAVQHARTQRLRTTLDRMGRIVEGMVGDPTRSGHGYVGDLGALPANLADLNTRGAQPLLVVDPNDGVGAGYNGPYVPQTGAAGAAFVDAWGSAFAYVAGVAQVSSAGPDRQFGTADDLLVPDAPPVAVGNVVVTLNGVPNDGGPACVLGDDDADVFVARSNAGVRVEDRVFGPVGSGGPFVGGAIHNGLHGVRVVGGGAFAGASVRDVVEVSAGSSQLRLALIQPAGPPPACGP